MRTEDSPKHPVPSLTSYELRAYRRALEHSLAAIAPSAPVCERLRVRLSEVRAEEESRARLLESFA
jgi:hypothetical protein